MKLREVHLLAEAVDDLEQGRSFYNAQQTGVGDYFIESVLGDISTLRLHAGFTGGCMAFFASYAIGFPSLFITKSVQGGWRLSRSWICGAARHGSGSASRMLKVEIAARDSALLSPPA